MSLSSGQKLGPYEIVAPLGAGGMGEVWRARDPRLGRDVAIKALPAGFEQDPERVARFEREAKLLASLSHPNVAGIFGLELVEGHRYLVLEFVEGETLAARLARGALPWREAAEVCRQIAAGVEAAHESGVVHRDLKPGNVMLKPDGTVKVLDFGLAKSGAAGSSGSDPNLSASPTMTYAATQQGVILGTAAYMSPEQARGRAVDRRTDIWSFGCVLYECLTGRKVYDGDTVSDMVARILEREPDWTALPAGTPPALRTLLERCLAKEPKARLQAIGEARIALEAKLDAAAAPAIAAPRRAGAPFALVAIVALVALALGLLLAQLRPAPRGPVTRLTVMSSNPAIEVGTDLGAYALAPDGSALAFTFADSSGTTRLAVRTLDDGAIRVIEGGDDARWPFWSPDSREIAFFAKGRLLRVPAAGGSVRTICEASEPRGASWGSAGLIVYCPDPNGGLWVVPADGGTPREVTKADKSKGENSHRFPSFLPDGKHFLFAVNSDSKEPLAPIRIGSTDGAPPREFGRSSLGAVFAAPDWVICSNDRALLAQRIDLGSLAPKGAPRLLRDQPEVNGSIILEPVVSCAANGLMAYAPADQRATAAEWVGADGRLIDTGVRFEGNIAVSSNGLSPDGTRLAVSASSSDGYTDWIADLRTGSASIVVPAARGVFLPIWCPDGRRLAGPNVNGTFFVDPAGTADSALDVPKAGWTVPTCFTPEGGALVLAGLVRGHRYDIQTLALRAGAAAQPYVATPADENHAKVSHDGQWVAYTSDASGRAEVVVEHFPDHAGAVRAEAPASGGGPLAWRADDRELFYMAADGGTILACDVHATPQLSLGTPHAIRHLPHEAGGAAIRSDGSVLALVPWGGWTRSLTIAANWQNEREEKR